MSHKPVYIHPMVYADRKIKILIRDFGFVLTEEERDYLRSLPTHNDIDRAVRTIIFNRLDD